jgi:hypothetical protein
MSKLTKSAKGRNCTIRLPGVCNHYNETVVLAHINGVRFGHGVGHKVNDLHGAYACSACHDIVDGRFKTHYTKEELKLAHYEGMIETQMIMIAEGLIREV